jgi:hypothetical protein
MQDGVIAQEILKLCPIPNGLSFQKSENPRPYVEISGFRKKRNFWRTFGKLKTGTNTSAGMKRHGA